jgi:methylated-DNA-[protein]-cysteine S-methyltransferase
MLRRVASEESMSACNGDNVQRAHHTLRKAGATWPPRLQEPRAMPTHYAGFETAIGRCLVAWGDRGLVAVQLPEADDAAMFARLRRRAAHATAAEPPPQVRQAIEAVRALLSGKRTDLSQLPLDMRGVPELHVRVYDIARRIPAGQTLTYGEIARRLGDPRLARAVGQALGRNPFAPVVPCHRVLAAHGRSGGFSAHGGVRTKLRLLAIEGATLSGTADLFAE